MNQLFVAGLFVHLYDRTVLFPAHCAVDLITVIALCRNRFLAKESLCVVWEEQQQVQQQSNRLQHGKLARRYRRNLNGHVQQMWSSRIPAARSSVELQARGAAPCYGDKHYCMVFRGSWFKSCLECLCQDNTSNEATACALYVFDNTYSLITVYLDGLYF